MVRNGSGITAAFGVALLAMIGAAPAAAQVQRPDISSPMRTGDKPGCRWVEVAPKTGRVCDSRTKVCRTQTTPAQRIWACGTVRH